jgi:hypothetical protein
MAYYSAVINGSQKVWMARVAYRGQRKSRVCRTKQDAKEAEAELLGVFRKAARAAGLQDFHFHDLRHNGATMALNKGFTAPIVMALGGWKTERMMRRYGAVTDQTLRDAADAVLASSTPPAFGRYAGVGLSRERPGASKMRGSGEWALIFSTLQMYG